jgi:hypothetical protein
MHFEFFEKDGATPYSPNLNSMCEDKDFKLSICNLTDDFYPGANVKIDRVEITHSALQIDVKSAAIIRGINFESHTLFENPSITNVVPTLRNGNVQNNGRFYITYPWFPLYGVQDATNRRIDDDDWTDSSYPCENLGIQIRRTGSASFKLIIDMDITVYYTTKLGSFEGMYSVHEEFPFNSTTSSTGSKTVNGGNLSQILSQPNSPLLAPTAALTTPQNIKVVNDLIIDQDYTFAGSANPTMTSFIQMEPEKSIIVKSGKSLTIKANMFGCASMWRAIEVENGARLIIDNSTIRDAGSAVYTPVSTTPNVVSTLRILNSQFIDNYIALDLQDKRAVMTVQNNTFKQEKDLMHAQFIDVEKALCAIQLGDEISFGEKKNIFEKLASGIVSTSTSYVEIYSEGSTYRNLGVRIAEANGFLANGHGIHTITAQSGKIQVIRTKFENFINKEYLLSTNAIVGTSVDLDIDDVTINDVNMMTGIYGYNSRNIKITNSKISVKNPILVQNGQLASCIIKANKIEAHRYGIEFSVTNNHGFSLIEDNTISCIPNKADINHTEIRIEECKGNGFLRIENNKMHYLFKYGILIFNSDNIHVFNNKIENLFKAPLFCRNTPIAICSTNGLNNIINCNEIILNLVYCTELGKISQKERYTGIEIDGEDMTSIGNNDIKTFFSSNCVSITGNNMLMSQRFFQNSLLNFDPDNFGNNRVLDLKQNSILGEQRHTENIFRKSWNGGIPVTNSVYCSGDEQLSKFYVDPTLNPDYFPLEVTPSIWFLKEPNSTPFPVTPCSPTSFRVATSYTDNAIINNGITTHPYWNAEMSYTAYQRMYIAYKNYPQNIEPNATFLAFIEQKRSTSIEKFEQIDWYKKYIGNIVLQNKTALTAKRTELNSLGAELRNLDEQITSGVGETNNLLQQRDTKQKSWEQLYIDVMKILAEIKTEDNAAVAKAIGLNNNIQVADGLQPEKNQKRLNEVYFNTVAKKKIKFTPEQWAVIDDIAHQCPDFGGDAVYEARSLYHLRDKDAIFDDSTYCFVKIHPNDGKQVFINNTPLFKVSPNPAADYVQLSYNLANAAMVQITDISGKVIYLTKYDTYGHLIETEGFRSGMYFISLLDDNKHIIQTQKLLISK